MGYAPILFRYYNQVSGLCQLMGGYLTLALPYKGDGITGMGSGAGGIGYNGAVEIAALRGGYVGYEWTGRLLRAFGKGA